MSNELNYLPDLRDRLHEYVQDINHTQNQSLDERLSEFVKRGVTIEQLDLLKDFVAFIKISNK